MSLRYIALIGLLICYSSSAIAQDDDLPSVQDLADASAKRFPQPVRVGDLLGRKVLRPVESAPTVGRVREIVKRADGTVAVVMDYGGFWGFFTHPIAVPVDAMVLLGQFMEVAEYEPDQLEKFPAFNSEGATTLPPNSIIRVGLAKPSH